MRSETVSTLPFRVAAAVWLCAGCSMPVDPGPAEEDAVGVSKQPIVVSGAQRGSPGYTTSQWSVSPDYDGEYDSIEQMVIPQQESPSDTFYMATNFYYHCDFATEQPDWIQDIGPLGYMGLQTGNFCRGTVRGTESCPDWCERCPMPQGKVALFSVWDGTSATSSGLAQRFGGEGHGYQTYISYEWQAGEAYVLRVTRTSDADPTYATTAWTGYIKNYRTGEEREIGTIRTPYTYGRLKNTVVNFTEYYGELEPCYSFLAMPSITVAFGRPSANFGTVYDPRYDTQVPNGIVVTNNPDRPTCAGAASRRASASVEYGTWALHRMFGRE